MITIFTPTYNRADHLKRLFESLKNQTCKEFEWVVVDDGSIDKTKEVVKEFITEDVIPVRYFYKPNGGKHTAINLGVKQAQGDLFWILDSDDSLPDNAVETVMRYVKALPPDEMDKLAGICGYMAHHNGEIIGKPFVKEPTLMSSIDMRYKYGMTGDMMEIFRTEVLRTCKFPEIQGERFCPESLVWNRIAKKYPLYLIPEVIYYRDYLDGGLTDNIIKIRMNSPLCAMMNYAENFVLDIPFKSKLRCAINYWRFKFCNKNRYYNVPIHSWGILIFPLGLLMHLRDLRIMKSKN